MKSTIKTRILFLVFFIGIWIIPLKTNSQVSVSLQVFYDDLSPYGTWVDNSDYGYVWVPGISAGFVPYGTNGYWVFTDLGWTWVSYYPWGWAPFHYGSWYYDPFYGYVWVPGIEWSPAWVVWRSSGSYYGWCPRGPGNYAFPNNYWTFVGCEHLGKQNINNYYVDRSKNVTIIQNTTVINNARETRSVTYNAGPDRADVEKHAGKPVNPVALKEASTSGAQAVTSNEVQIYRPRVEKVNANGTTPAPSKVTNLKDAKAPAQKPAEAVPQKAKPQTTSPQQQSKQPVRQTPAPQQQKQTAPQQQQQHQQVTPQQKQTPAPQQQQRPQVTPQPQQKQAPAPQPQQQQPKHEPAPQQQPQQPQPQRQQTQPPSQPPSQPRQPNPPPNNGGGKRPR